MFLPENKSFVASLTSEGNVKVNNAIKRYFKNRRVFAENYYSFSLKERRENYEKASFINCN